MPRKVEKTGKQIEVGDVLSSISAGGTTDTVMGKRFEDGYWMLRLKDNKTGKVFEWPLKDGLTESVIV